MKEEKTELKKNFTKLTQKKGISLIVLIVTIIVIIILAAVVILTVGKNNPIDSANEAKFKEDVRSFQDELALSISKDYTKKAGQRDNKFNATTFEEIQNYIPSFSDKYKGKIIIENDELMYKATVADKEKKWLEALGIRRKTIDAQEVLENPKVYYGSIVKNYTTGNSQVDNSVEWKIFHSDGNNIYLIASDYLPVDILPTTAQGNKPKKTSSYYPNGASPTSIINDYKGSSDIIDEKLKSLNSDYFDKGYTSINSNMKVVAYMLDTKAWSKFAGEYAEYAIGGPTLEILIASYSNKYEIISYKANAVSSTGYKISKDGGKNWAYYYNGMLGKKDNLYVINSKSKAYAMWLASPSDQNSAYVMSLHYDDYIAYHYHIYDYPGFRPLVCLKSDIQLEADGNGYKIK